MSKRFVVFAALMAFSAASLLGSAPRHGLHNHAATFLAPTQRMEAAGQASPGEGKILYYKDPMHPWYHSDKPGIAPDCGMKLVPVYASELADQPKPEEPKILYYQDAMNPSYHSDKPGLAPDGMKLVPVYASETSAALPPGGVAISSARQQLMGVTSAPAEYRTLDRVIRTTGEVNIDETRIASVSTRVSGWVQKVFVDSTFQHVTKGEPLFTVYSPDLLATEQEFLLALRARKTLGQSSLVEVNTDGASLLEAARMKLSLLDVTPDQIRDLETTGKPEREITIYSPAVGHVLERKVFPNQYVTPESELYKIVDHTSMWIYAEVYEVGYPLRERRPGSGGNGGSVSRPKAHGAREFCGAAHDGGNPHRTRAHGVPQPRSEAQARDVRKRGTASRPGAAVDRAHRCGAGFGHAPTRVHRSRQGRL